MSLPFAAKAQTTQFGLYQTCQLQTTQGQAVAGAQVYFLTQPANTSSLTPQAQVYSSATGGAVSQPVLTNGQGTCTAYLSPGTYTVCYVSPYTGTLCNPDQNVPSPSGSTSTVSSISIIAGGSYTVCPTGITFSGGEGSGAAATPVCTASGGGFYVSGATVTAGGSYINVPSIAFTGGTGSGAVGIAIMNSFPGVVPVASGGTGATEAATALTNLSGVSTLITSTQALKGPITSPQVNWVFDVDGNQNTTAAAAIQGCLNNATTAAQNYLNGTGTISTPACKVEVQSGWLGLAADALGGPWDMEIPCNGTSPNVVCTVPTPTTGQCSTLVNTKCVTVALNLRLGPWGDYTLAGPFTATSYLQIDGEVLGNASGGSAGHGTAIKCNASGQNIPNTPASQGCIVQGLNGAMVNNLRINNTSFVGATGNSSESAIWIDSGSQIGGGGGLTDAVFDHLNFNGFNGDTLYFNGGSDESGAAVQQSKLQDVQVYIPSCSGAGYGLVISGSAGSWTIDGGNISRQNCTSGNVDGPEGNAQVRIGDSATQQTVTGQAANTYSVTSGVMTVLVQTTIPLNAGQQIHYPAGAWTTSPATGLNNSTVQVTSVSGKSYSGGLVLETITFATPTFSNTSATTDPAAGVTLATYYGHVTIQTLTGNGATMTITGTTTVPISSSSEPDATIFFNGLTNSADDALNGQTIQVTGTPVYTGGTFYNGVGVSFTVPSTINTGGTQTDSGTGYVQSTNAFPYSMNFENMIVEGQNRCFDFYGGNQVNLSGDHSEDCAEFATFYKATDANNMFTFNHYYTNGNVGTVYFIQTEYTNQSPLQIMVNDSSIVHPAILVQGAANTGQVIRFTGNNINGTYTMNGTVPAYVITASAGLSSVTAISGGGISGTGTVTLSGFNGSCSGSAATIILNSGVYEYTSSVTAGTGCTSAPTSATCTSGTATCSGTVTITSALNSTPGIVNAQPSRIIDLSGTTPLCGFTNYWTPGELITTVFTGSGMSVAQPTYSSPCGGTANIGWIGGGTTWSACQNGYATWTYNDVTSKFDMVSTSCPPSYATTAGNLTGTPALPNGVTATTQTYGDNTTALATDAFVQAAVSGGVAGVSSFNGRTGIVVPATNDYSFSQISGTLGTGSGGTGSTGGTGYRYANGASADTYSTTVPYTSVSGGIGTLYKLLSPYVSTTESGTSGQNTITVASATGISAGQVAVGTGIPSLTFVTGVSGTTVTLSANTTTTPSGTVTFSTENTGSTSTVQVFSLAIPANTVTTTGALRISVGYGSCTGSAAPFSTCTTANTGTCSPTVYLGGSATTQAYTIQALNTLPATKGALAQILVQQQGSLSSEIANSSITSSNTGSLFGTVNMGNTSYITIFMTNSVSGDQCYVSQVNVQVQP
jgi:hypothetical protein